MHFSFVYSYFFIFKICVRGVGWKKGIFCFRSAEFKIHVPKWLMNLSRS